MPPWVAQRVNRARTLSFIASAGVAAVVLVHVAKLVCLEVQVVLLERIAAHVSVAPGEAAANDARIAALEAWGQIVWYASGVVFLIWVYTAHVSLEGLRRDEQLDPTPGWAVAGYFIPLLNLVRPYTDMATLARLSDPRDLEVPTVQVEVATAGYREAAVREVAPLPWSPPPAVVGLWWAGYILQTLSVYGLLLMGKGDGIPAMISQTHAHMARDVLLLVTGALCIGVIRGITACQRERARRLELLESAAA